MKKLLVGLLALGSISAFAGKAEVICSSATNSQEQAINELNVLHLSTKNVSSISGVTFIENNIGVKACVSIVTK